MVSPGVATRKPRVNRRLPGWRTALMVCHAISIAITVVLPAPVASLSAKPGEAGICRLVGRLQALHELPALASGAGGNLGQPDHRLYRFDLTEERTDVAELVVPPVVQQPRGLGGDPPLGAGQPAPLVYAVAHALDHPHQLILLPVVVRRPAGIIETQLGLVQALLAGGGDRGDERDAPAAVDDTGWWAAGSHRAPSGAPGTRKANSGSAVQKTAAPRRQTTRNRRRE